MMTTVMYSKQIIVILTERNLFQLSVIKCFILIYLWVKIFIICFFLCVLIRSRPQGFTLFTSKIRHLNRYFFFISSLLVGSLGILFCYLIETVWFKKTQNLIYRILTYIEWYGFFNNYKGMHKQKRHKKKEKEKKSCTNGTIFNTLLSSTI